MLAAEVMLEVARGKDPAAEKRAERSKGTFGELAGPYVEEYAKRHNKSWRQADTLVRRHLLSRWGALQAASISRSDIKAMMTGIEAPVVPAKLRTCAASTPRTAGGKCRESRCRRWAGPPPAPRTRKRIGCGSLSRCRPFWP
jgi:hypothetical protein